MYCFERGVIITGVVVGILVTLVFSGICGYFVFDEKIKIERKIKPYSWMIIQVTVESKDVKVIKRDWVYATVRDIWDANEDALTDDKVEELYTTLKELSNVD